MFSPLSHLTPMLVQRFQLKRGLEASRVMRAWPQAVALVLGAKFPAPDTLQLRDAVLWLSMPSSVVAQEVQLSKAQLLQSLAELLGDATKVTDIRFKLARADHASDEVGRRG